MNSSTVDGCSDGRSISSRKTGAEGATEKKKIKLLKQGLKDARQEIEALKEELKTMQERNKELTLEGEKTSSKYLKLYDENDKL